MNEPTHQLDGHVSGLSVTTRFLQLHVGRDETVFNSPENPSGFDASFSRPHVKRLLEIVGEESDRVLSAAPPELIETLRPEDRSIGVYRMRNPGVVSAVFDTRNPNRLHQNYDPQTLQVTPIGYLPPEQESILITASADADPEELKRLPVGHESAHLASVLALHGNQHPMMEAFVARIERDLYGEREGMTSDYDWDRSSLRHTSGCLPRTDFGSVSIRRCVPAMESMYLASYFASDLISSEQVWKIWTLLSRHTRASGFMPQRGHVFAAVRSVLGDDADALLNNPTFKSMTPGMNVVSAHTKNHDMVSLYGFDVQSNPQFGQIIGGVRHEIELVAVPARAAYEHIIRGAQRNIIEAGGTAQPIERFTHAGLWSKFAAAAPNSLLSQVRSAMTGMSMKPAGLDEIELRPESITIRSRPANTPATEAQAAVPSARPPRDARADARQKEEERKKKQKRKEEKKNKKRNR